MKAAKASNIFDYAPSSRFGLGIDDKSGKFHAFCVRWVEEKEWIETQDGFDYGKAARRITLPLPSISRPRMTCPWATLQTWWTSSMNRGTMHTGMSR
ncbi:MAG TPA: hypothetical protein PLM53_05770 [Spirochaetota bacterium]|nr:hypothetical protein [Spirochaetota bacterium]HPL16399.1 hypothetical protein [Spirochaetota bacterium]HQF08028.1 hypothetical protein [Spirochaetota bacterium]HQH96588.1 hypothetical protein [Spirochaetota bacterium]HQJ69760.1 hypothetical protein [Spirochaetota bacterium]